MRFGFGQSTLKEMLRQDFASSREKPYSLHPYWYAVDTVNIGTRDTVIFHNKPAYYLGVKSTCQWLNWSFTSSRTINQSSYFSCVGHGYSVSAVNGSGAYSFKLKEAAGQTYLKLINHKFQVSWFAVFRSLEYDSRNVAYPVITLVRLKHKPV
ncbi:hypothetical protein [Hymenobacter gummosus]|uniref:hypothetical protein n=1 Tax=Hymenobacter gummosus TaxID=1776032 RepID=UPI0014054EEE|nr:hypothetical protein [Hymenobacter gummosus]